MGFDTTIFITGFPGFIAGRLVERLAQTDRQFYLLVQPPFLERSKELVEEIARRTNTPLENFSLVDGDITLPDLGMSDEDARIVEGSTTHSFHLAAIYDLAVSRDAAYKVNLGGTKNVNDLMRRLPHLRRYNYISTCYVAGKREGRIGETDLKHAAGFRNFYEESKYLAELEVEALKADLPVTIFRPAVVVGDSDTGETAKYDGIYFLVQYLKKAPGILRLVNVGNKKVRLNLVPVDFVVDAIASLAFDEAAVEATIALADPAPLSTQDLFDLIAENLSGKRSLVSPPPVIVENFLMLPISPSITGLPHSAVPYFFIEQSYDTRVAERLLQAHDIECPSFNDYIGNLLNFVEKHPRL